MKKWNAILSLLLAVMIGLCIGFERAEKKEYALLQQTPVRTEPLLPETTAVEETLLPATVPPETAPETPAETTLPVVLDFTEEEEALLLKLAAAERGDTGCVTCMALVMRTVLNRVEAPKFSSTVRGVIYAQDQFTPVMDGSFENAVPDRLCEEALDRIRRGWDESQGALYYEWCEGESWHSRNLNLLLQHCDTRFYN